MLLLDRDQVEATLDLDRLVDAVESAMVDLSHGVTSMPTRMAASVDEHHGLLLAMPAFVPSARALTTKLVSLFPENRDRPTHQAVIVCFDPDTGSPVAVMDGTYITATRTAAGSALATRLLARPGASVVAVIGTGVQARSHARALSRLDGVELVLVAGRDRAKALALVGELIGEGIAATVAASIEAAVRRADVVCTTTDAGAPVVHRRWLRPGTHINAVGWNATGAGELDLATIGDALVVVESRAAALAPPPSTGADDLRHAIEAGVLGADVAELGEVAAGDRPGRTDDDQLTLYRSIGVAVQDAAAAALVLARAR